MLVCLRWNERAAAPWNRTLGAGFNPYNDVSSSEPRSDMRNAAASAAAAATAERGEGGVVAVTRALTLMEAEVGESALSLAWS